MHDSLLIFPATSNVVGKRFYEANEMPHLAYSHAPRQLLLLSATLGSNLVAAREDNSVQRH
jgi:hypothetical protein